jgi:hypothetical protein
MGSVCVEFVGVVNPIRDSFHDLLLSGSEFGHNTPSSGASCDPTQECFIASTPQDCSPLEGSLEETHASIVMRVATSAPPQIDLPS